MELAEAAQEEALRDMQPQPRPRTSPYDPQPLETRRTVFIDMFALISRNVRQAILLEARLAAPGAYDRAAPASLTAPTPLTAPIPPPTTPHDPATPSTAGQNPDNAEPAPRPHAEGLRAEPLEDECAADATRDPEDILAGIEAALGTASERLAPTPHTQTDETATPWRPRPRRVFPPPPTILTAAERSAELYRRDHPDPPATQNLTGLLTRPVRSRR